MTFAMKWGGGARLPLGFTKQQVFFYQIENWNVMKYLSLNWQKFEKVFEDL